MKKFLDIEGLRHFWEIILNHVSTELRNVGAKELIEVKETGFYLVDENMNIGFKYDEQGIDTHAISQHFKKAVGATGGSGETLNSLLSGLNRQNPLPKDDTYLRYHGGKCAWEPATPGRGIEFDDMETI